MVLTYLVLPVLPVLALDCFLFVAPSGAMLSTSNTGGGMSVVDLFVPVIFEVVLVGKAPDRSAAGATELLRLLMVVAGEEVGTDDEDDEGGAAPVVTTTPTFFTSPLLPRHRGRQLMPAVGWPGWDSIQTQLFAEHKTALESNRRSERVSLVPVRRTS